MGGQPAYKLIGTYTDSGPAVKFTVIETGTVVGFRIYYIYALVKADQYFNYLPIIDKMINSFAINNATKSTSSTTSPPIVTNYVNYTNTNYGVSIQYPSNWIKNETQQGQIYTEFDSPEATVNNFYNVYFRLAIDNTTSITDISNYLQNEIKIFRSSPGFQNFQVVESVQIIIWEVSPLTN